MLVCTFGDLLLDVVAILERAPVTGDDVGASTQILPGGQAANVAAWVSVLGGEARFVGKLSDDLGGRLAIASLSALGVDVRGPVGGGRGGIVVSLVAPDGERSMASDRGGAAEIRPDELEPEWLACDHLHVSGYSLALEPMRSAALEAARLARTHGARLSVDLAAATVIEAVGASVLRPLLENLEPDVVFSTADEDEAIGGPFAGPHWIVKRGAAGVTVDGEDHAAATVDSVVDATGAGDAFAAGWIVGGLPLALETAARCVARAGAFPLPAAPPRAGG